MTSVSIADVEAALDRVRAFITLLEEHYRIYNAIGSRSPEAPQLRAANDKIQEEFPLIRRIAEQADPDIMDRLKKDSYGWPYYRVREASQQLAGLLGSLEEAERILGPIGPKLAAANLHPWIWNPAVSLWDDGHRREAVQAAATALFDHHLPAKLGVSGTVFCKGPH